MIYKWNSIESFNRWHEAIQELKGIPNEFASTYTEFYEVNETDIRALVRDEDADLLPDLIGQESEPLIEATSM